MMRRAASRTSSCLAALLGSGTMELALKCDKCTADAVFGFSFQTQDGQLLSPVRNVAGTTPWSRRPP